jgi:galactokinase
MDELLTQHRAEYGREPEVVVSAPGTANIIGEHTDYNDGLVIEAAIDRNLYVALSRRSDNSLRFFAADLNERKRTTLQNLKFRREDRWANYPKGVLHELMQLDYDFTGFDLTVSSEIPSGIGLGSSAAFGVASAAAFAELFGIELSEFQIVQSAAMAELSFMGIETSLTDHLVSTVSRDGSCVFVDLRELSYDFIPLDLSDIDFLVTISNVPQISSVQDLELRRLKCASCLSVIKESKTAQTLRDISVEDLRDVLDGLPEDARRLCTHVVQENDRVRQATKLLEEDRYEQLGKLLTRSQDSLRDSYEVSCPEIDWLIKRAAETEGVLGSRMVGPGFGGCTLSLIHKEAVDTYLDSIEEYERIFGFKPESFKLSPVSGARRLPILVS